MQQFPPVVTSYSELLLLVTENAEELDDEDEATLSSLAWRLNHLGQTAVFARLINQIL